MNLNSYNTPLKTVKICKSEPHDKELFSIKSQGSIPKHFLKKWKLFLALPDFSKSCPLKKKLHRGPVQRLIKRFI